MDDYKFQYPSSRVILPDLEETGKVGQAAVQGFNTPVVG